MGSINKIKKNIKERQNECECELCEIVIDTTHYGTQIYKYKCIKCGSIDRLDESSKMLAMQFMDGRSMLSRIVHNKTINNTIKEA